MIEEHAELFIVRDAIGQALGYFLRRRAAHRRAVTKRLNKDKARRIAVNFAKAAGVVAPEARQPVGRPRAASGVVADAFKRAPRGP
jgi:hypothetical protein